MSTLTLPEPIVFFVFSSQTYKRQHVEAFRLLCSLCVIEERLLCPCVQVLLIGESGVGKSTLVGRLCEDRFMPEHRQYTLGKSLLSCDRPLLSSVRWLQQ